MAEKNLGDDINPQYDIYGRFANSDGTFSGAEFVISNASNDQQGCSVAYDRVNQKFLAVWRDSRSSVNNDIYGQLVTTNGSLSGTAFVISDAANDQIQPSVDYDSTNQRFLVVWMDFRSGAASDVYGQLVNAGGSLTGSNFVISNAANDQSYPSVAYDGVNQRFLITWSDFRGGAFSDIYGQLVNAGGSLNGSNFVISDAANNQGWPSVAYDNVNQKFLAVWEDYRSVPFDIYGQLVDAGGSLNGVNFVISSAGQSQNNPSVAYDIANQRFLVAWHDYRDSATTGSDIYGQFVNDDGSLYNTAADVNFSISVTADDDEKTHVVNNSLCSNFLVANRSTDWNTFSVLQLNVVGPGCETTPPAVSSTSPAGDATSVALTASVTAIFSEALRESTITGTTFTLKDNLNAVVNGAVSYNVGSKTATFTPSASLSYSTTYTATITAGVKDIVGNAMTSNYTWSFTTLAAPVTNNPPAAPTLVSPSDGQTGLGTTVEFRWKKVTDPDGDAMAYSISYCTDQSFTGCTPVDVAALNINSVTYAGFGWIGLLFFGMAFAGSMMRSSKFRACPRKLVSGVQSSKRIWIILVVVMISMTGALLVSCGGNNGGGGGLPADQMSYTASGLDSGATYYWKITADDGKGGTAESDVWSFSTQ